MTTHEQQKMDLLEQARRLGMNKGNIKVLSTDPYYVGSPGDYADAKWAAGLWDKMMSNRKKPLHLRGFHYWIQSQGIVKPNGIKYAHGNPKDTKAKQDKAPGDDWTYLLHSTQLARYLGIGTWANLVDMKHPDPEDYDNYWIGSGMKKNGDVDIQGTLNDKLAGIVNDFTNELLKQSPCYADEGYQMYHMEVLCEKNSMGFVIEPACRRYEACYQPFVGQASVEKIDMMADRAIKAAKAGKKVRIFYISDWDRYGKSMIPAVARKIEFFTRGIKADVKLMRLAMTDSQIKVFKLPFAPKHGEDVVELDALEAIHPGALGKIVGDALRPYYDPEKPQIVRDENSRIRDVVRDMLEEQLKTPLEEAFQNIDIDEIAGDFSLKDAIDPNFKPPVPGHEVDDSDGDWVYDSSRDFWTQLEEYKKYKSAGEDED
jgi:hypothetical protein